MKLENISFACLFYKKYIILFLKKFFLKFVLFSGVLLAALFALRTNLNLINKRAQIKFLEEESISSSSAKFKSKFKTKNTKAITATTLSVYQVSSGQRSYNHSPALLSLDNGDLLAVWYAGEREGGNKMELRIKSFSSQKKRWQHERVIIDNKRIPYLTRRIGNPLIFQYPSLSPEPNQSTPKRLFVLFTSTLSGWSTSYLNLIESNDGGQSWQNFQRLYLGNIFNFSHLVRCKPLFLEENRVLVPVYQEFINKFALALELDLSQKNGLIQTSQKLSKLREGIQPAFLLEKQKKRKKIKESKKENKKERRESVSLLAFLRNTNETDQSGKLILSKLNLLSAKKKSTYLELESKDTPVSTLRYDEDRILLIYTDSKTNDLRLALLNKDYEFEKDLLTLDQESKYPYLIRGRKKSGLVHLVYAKQISQAHGAKKIVHQIIELD